MSRPARPHRDRLLDSIEYDTNGGCWLYRGTLNWGGYGMFAIGGGRSDHAHRASFRAFKGDIPKGLFVCHRCDVKACVNPDHLFLGTPAENSRDRDRKGRGARDGPTTFPRKLTDEQVVELRRLRATEGLTYDVLAARFGVSVPLVAQIVNGLARKTSLLMSQAA